MNALAKVAIGLGSTVGGAFGVDALHTVHIKRQAWNFARGLAGERGIINLGAGPHRATIESKMIAWSPEVALNADIVVDGLPRFRQVDMECTLPFTDNQFACAFASHVLEHLDNWGGALEEMARVADRVVVVLPHPLSPSGWLSPSHKQHFSVDDIDDMRRICASVVVFY